MPYIHFTEEQKLRANSVDLAEFLRRQGEKLIPSGRDKRLASDHSITVRGNEWYDHESKEGGKAISFVQTFYGLSYPDAVKRLLDGEGIAYAQAQPEPEAEKQFALPPANQTMRRTYAYLLQERLISRDILSAFAHKKLIYESRELSKDKMKEYRNAVFVGFDEHGVARHAHKRSLYSKGKSYRGNVTGSDPRYSFHWTGTSNQLYVFEAPIDLLAFLSLHPTKWQSHSYVALCGTGEQAMLWMLKQSPARQEIILCLDHDAAGIEATGRLTDILREQGYSQITTMQSQYKDWDEDLRAQHNLSAQPAEEHPQLLAAESVCARIAMKCAGIQPDRVLQRLPAMFQFYRTCMEGNKLDTAMDCIEEIAAMSLQVVLRECRQLGADLTITQGGQFLKSRILPHQNRSSLKRRTEEISSLIQRAVDQSGAPGIRGEAEKRAIAGAWLDLAIACAKVSVKQDADERKLMHTVEATPSEQEQSMQAG